MDQGLIYAILGVGGVVAGALITSFLQPLLAKRLETKASLLVKIKHNSYKNPEFLRGEITGYVYDYKRKSALKSESEKIFMGAYYNECLSEIEFVNTSTKTINSVSFMIGNGEYFTIDLHIDGRSTATSYTNVAEIGSIRPNSICKAYVWTSFNYDENVFYENDRFIKVSAEEIHSIKIENRIPSSLSSIYQFNKKTLNNKFFFLGFIAIISVTYTFIDVAINISK